MRLAAILATSLMEDEAPAAAASRKFLSFLKIKTNNSKPTQILKGTDYHVLKSIKDHHVQFLTETVYSKLSHLFIPLRKSKVTNTALYISYVHVNEK